MREKIDILKSIAEPNRVRILLMLLRKSLCVCEITSILKLSAPTVSNHLAYLRDKGFIEDEKDGKWINYRIAGNQNEMIRNLLELLPKWFCDEDIVKLDKESVKIADRLILCDSLVKKNIYDNSMQT